MSDGTSRRLSESCHAYLVDRATSLNSADLALWQTGDVVRPVVKQHVRMSIMLRLPARWWGALAVMAKIYDRLECLTTFWPVRGDGVRT